MFLPTTPEELKRKNIKQLDIIIVSGDTYIDNPFIGASIIGKYLYANGFTVGIIAQPNISNGYDIKRLGEPKLFWGVTGGSVDSMVANYTASLKKRKSDDFTPGGLNNKRPDRAVIKYSNLIRQHFKNTVPIVLGGIEASLRRIAHYDYWSDKIRKSILLDAKADFLIYGMGEKATLNLAKALKEKSDPKQVKGLCYLSTIPPKDFYILPSFDEVYSNKDLFIKMFDVFYKNNDPLNSTGLVQKYDNRYWIQNPPEKYLTQKELDEIHRLDFERSVHPYYAKEGKVKATETINFSITSHRGCYGECNFCAIAVHQGRTIRWRSKKSILTEAKHLTEHKEFKGYIFDVGGPTANMYGYECEKKLEDGACKNKRCIFPNKCNLLKVNHSEQIALLNEIKSIKGIKKVFVASGLRYDLILEDKKFGHKYLENLIKNNISGQLKIAPEHTSETVLAKMGKPSNSNLIKFTNEFYRINKKNNLKQFLTYYFIAAHPGCGIKEMKELKSFVATNLKLNPEQVQIFTPTPSTYSTLMYFTEKDISSSENIFVEKKLGMKIKQKKILQESINKGFNKLKQINSNKKNQKKSSTKR